MARILVAILLLALVSLGLFALFQGQARSEPAPTLTVTRGTVVRKALAVGTVEPQHESTVNTQLAGVVTHLFAQLGQKVAAGAPLVEVRPVLTERDLLSAERSLRAAMEGEEAAGEFVQGSHLLSYLMRFVQGQRSLDRMGQAAARGRRSAEETLRLLREGSVDIDGRTVDFVVRAPVAGHVLSLLRQGDPVTPASNFGAGTTVAVIGDLDRPVFRGTVDEIDVGRLQEGMAATVRLGALPEVTLGGTVTEIGLRARRQDNAATFDVRIALAPAADVRLRSGYSAVAEVELERTADALVLPERAVAFRDGGAWVLVRTAAGDVERQVQTGTSDGLTVAIRAGLAEGDVVLDRAALRR